MDAMNFIVEEGLIMIPVLFIIGMTIKNTKVMNNKWIPLVLLLISLAFTPLVIGGYTAYNMVQAVLVSGVTVFADQLGKQIQKG